MNIVTKLCYNCHNNQTYMYKYVYFIIFYEALYIYVLNKSSYLTSQQVKTTTDVSSCTDHMILVQIQQCPPLVADPHTTQPRLLNRCSKKLLSPIKTKFHEQMNKHNVIYSPITCLCSQTKSIRDTNNNLYYFCKNILVDST